MPAYNAQAYIGDAIRSAIAQTWERKEIIIVDDGSTDRTLDVARRFESNCVKIVTQENQGAAAARNKALSLSRGDYIQYLDADDLLAPDKITRQIEAANHVASDRTLISGGWGSFFYRYYRANFISTPLWCDLSPTEWMIRKMESGVFIQTGSWLVSRTLTDAAGPWNIRMWEDDDGEYFCRVLLACDGVRFVPEAKVYYRATGPGSVGHIGNSDKKRNAHWYSMQFHISSLRSLDDSERVREACVRYLQRAMVVFYPERPDIVKDARDLARQLGGQLETPGFYWTVADIFRNNSLRDRSCLRKLLAECVYACIKSVLGWRFAQRSRLYLPTLYWSAIRLWDKTLFRMQRRNVGCVLENKPQ